MDPQYKSQHFRNTFSNKNILISLNFSVGFKIFNPMNNEISADDLLLIILPQM